MCVHANARVKGSAFHQVFETIL